MENQKLLLKDEVGEEVDVHLYRSIIGSLMYLTSSRPDITFAVCAYARYQVNPKVSHLHAVKMIFRYLKGQPKLGIWYPKDLPFDLVAYTDSDYARASLDRKSTIGCSTNQKFNFSKYIFESMVKNLENVSGKFLMYPRFVQVFLEKQLEGMSNLKRIYVTPTHTKKIFGNMRRVGKGFSGRETPLFPTMMVQAQEEMGESSANLTNPYHTCTIIQPSTYQPQKKQKPRKPKRKDTEVPQPSGPTDNVADEAVYEEMDDSGGPRRQDTMGDTIDQTGFENVSKTSNDPLLAKGGSRTHKLKRLYKVGRSARIVSSDEASLGDQEDASKHGRTIDDIHKDAEITLVDETQGRYGDDIMFDVSNLASEEVFVAEQGVLDSKKDDVVSTASAATTVSIASTIPVSAASITDEQAPTPTVSSQQPSQAKIQDKGKGKMVEPEPVKKFSKKDQIRLDEELDFSIHDELEEED
ncbi:hypothetical protein Tco_0815971 [Tanacetum coccineum]